MDFLARERRLSSVQADVIGAAVLYGGSQRLARLQHLWSRIENDDTSFGKDHRPFLNHQHRYIDACRKIKNFLVVVEEEQLTNLDDIYDAYLAIDESLPIDVHLSMFIPIMEYHTSPEQKALWLEAARSFRIIGAYAQTELTHGSNVRGIETTATFDQTTDEFVIHSPALTSAKWWPGGLAHTATHACVYANLLVHGKNYGPHPFLVQLRSLIDHTLYEGIETGDIGPKAGYNSMDNGYSLFLNVRIPRTQMLMGYAQVSPTGQYTKQDGAEKVAYGIMLDVRARICVNSAYVLARALTISIRYSCVRTQGFASTSSSSKEKESGERTELAVLEYPTQQQVLMPLLALSYALHFTGAEVRRDYRRYTASQDMSLLPDLHASSAGLKALITYRVSEGVEACRKMCGGHGFLSNAGFVELQTSYLAFCTLEGTKEVLQQQTGRYLLKQLQGAMKSTTRDTGSARTNRRERSLPLSPRTAYLAECVPFLRTTADPGAKQTPLDVGQLLRTAEGLYGSCGRRRTTDNGGPLVGRWSTAGWGAEYQKVEEGLLRAHRRRAAWCVALAGQTVDMAATASEDPLMVASVEICQAAEAHSELQIVEAFARGVRQLQTATLATPSTPPTPPTAPIAPTPPTPPSADTVDEQPHQPVTDADRHAFRVMFFLHAISVLRLNSGQFLASRIVRAADYALLSRVEGLLCAVVRADAVNLVEAWQFSDRRLDSTLGRADGHYAEALYAAAQREPLNATGVSEGYHLHLKDVINRAPSLPISPDGRLLGSTSSAKIRSRL